jgi:hypothetical protein
MCFVFDPAVSIPKILYKCLKKEKSPINMCYTFLMKYLSEFVHTLKQQTEENGKRINWKFMFRITAGESKCRKTKMLSNIMCT